jgi:hypothetical protein
MDTNAVADELATYLETKHARVYRNKAKQSPELPYIVYRIDTVSNTVPSEDYLIIVDVYEDASKSVREIEGIADAIDAGINHKVIDTEKLNMHFERDIRQYVSSEELISLHMVQLQYTARIYFKGEI